MVRQWKSSLALAAFAAVVFGAIASAATIDESIAAVQSVDKFGKGHDAAITAAKQLESADARDLPRLLAALDKASPLASNWLRNAFESVADRTLLNKQPLPAAEFEQFVIDRGHAPRARRLAYEWLLRVDPAAEKRLIPGMLQDPSPEFRRDAVAARMAEAAKIPTDKDKERAIAAYREALSGAVHEDQVKPIAEALAKLGQKVNVTDHFAFITSFQAIGPFDNKGGKGFAAVYPPEQELKLDAEYVGQLGKVRWEPLSTKQEMGIVDIAKSIKPYKGAAMYVTSTFNASEPRTLDVRIGTPNAWKLWVNGKFQFAREEYHRGMEIDQYRVPVTLQAGPNTLLLKICQNEQTPDWAQRYEFQLRVSDEVGSGVLSKK